LNDKVLSVVNIRTEDIYMAVGVSSTHQERQQQINAESAEFPRVGKSLWKYVVINVAWMMTGVFD
jgi:hypothetical protein